MVREGVTGLGTGGPGSEGGVGTECSHLRSGEQDGLAGGRDVLRHSRLVLHAAI